MTILDETLVRLTEAGAHVPGHPVHYSTVVRWCRVGARGKKLESVLVGGMRYTSKQAIARFIANVTEAGNAATIGGAVP